MAGQLLQVCLFACLGAGEQKTRSVFLLNCERLFIQRLGLGVGAGGVVERGEVVERGGGVGVLGAQRLLPDRQRPLVERLGLGVGPVAW